MRPFLLALLLPLAAVAGVPACHTSAAASPAQAAKQTMHVTSAAFASGAGIPPRYTCSGADVSPPLSWTGVPARAKSLAILVDDPDAPGGVFTHWMAWDLAASTTHLAEGSAGGAVQGTNDFGKRGWRGPCPPPGSPHHYRFQVLALDAAPHLSEGADRAAFDKALAGHVLAAGTLTALFGR